MNPSTHTPSHPHREVPLDRAGDGWQALMRWAESVGSWKSREWALGHLQMGRESNML